MHSVHTGDSLEVLRTLEAESVDAIVTDPPYGLGTREPTVDEIIAYLQGTSTLNTNGDFMGKRWSIPPVDVWRECLRVLKPGGHLLCFGGTRTFDLISLGLRAAGFENRDTVSSYFGSTTLAWVQGQGFPKSLNVEKAINKLQGATSEDAAKWQGWGTALKPSWEPILVFRKPLAEGTVVAQVLVTGTGALNIDASRIPGVPEATRFDPSKHSHDGWRMAATGAETAANALGKTGRWPGNLLLIHSEGCQVVGTKKVKAPVINRFDDGMKPFGDGAGHAYISTQTGDAEGLEEIPVYECVEGCPVKLLDQQSGERPSTLTGKADATQRHALDRQHTRLDSDATTFRHQASDVYADSGGASRFFGQFQPDAPFLYVGKASKTERNAGLPSEGSNTHPTVKPLALMTWLVQLVTPPGGTVLDPYLGSGSTGIAALIAGANFIGIEHEAQYADMAKQRLAAFTEITEEAAPPVP